MPEKGIKNLLGETLPDPAQAKRKPIVVLKAVGDENQRTGLAL